MIPRVFYAPLQLKMDKQGAWSEAGTITVSITSAGDSAHREVRVRKN